MRHCCYHEDRGKGKSYSVKIAGKSADVNNDYIHLCNPFFFFPQLLAKNKLIKKKMKSS